MTSRLKYGAPTGMELKSLNEPLMPLDKIEELIKRNGKATGTLIGVDGNAMSVMGYVSRQLKRAGWPRADINQVTSHMMSGDYTNVIVTGMAVLDEE